jgi:hypothetical protein
MALFVITGFNRLFFLDIFRGLIMFLPIAEAAGFHENFAKSARGTARYGARPTRASPTLEWLPFMGLCTTILFCRPY